MPLLGKNKAPSSVLPGLGGGKPTDANPQAWQELPRLIERMHRRFLDVLRQELGRLGIEDVSPVQVMMLYNIGSSEISVRDLVERGYYLGSNASYNLKGLVDNLYVERKAALRDKRAARLKLSAKGLKLLEQLRAFEEQLLEPLLRDKSAMTDFETSVKTLRRLERRWSDAVHFDGDFGEDV